MNGSVASVRGDSWCGGAMSVASVRAAAATPGAREENKSHSHYTHHHHRHRAANARAAATRSLGTRAKLHHRATHLPPLLPALSEPATPLHRPALLSRSPRYRRVMVVAASQRAGFLLLLFDGAVGGGISRVPLARITRRSYGAVFLFAFPPCTSLERR